MTNPMLAELDAVVRLSECATPGPWHRHTDCPGKCCWHIFTAPDGIYGPEPEGKGDSSLINSPEMAEEDASYIVALSNFLRTHHATLADMAKRMEAAERDAGLFAAAECRAEKAVGGHGVRFELRFDPLEGHNGSLREYLQHAINATQEGEG